MTPDRNQARSGLSPAQWETVQEMYEFVMSDECEDTYEARNLRYLCRKALGGSFQDAQVVISLLEEKEGLRA